MKILLAALLLSLNVFAQQTAEDDIQEIHQERLKQYNTMIDAFKKVGINPESFNDVVFDTNSQGVKDQLKSLAGEIDELEGKLGGEAEHSEKYNALKSELRSLRAKAYKAERLVEEQADIPQWKKDILETIMPISRKVANVVMQPSVMESLIKLYQPEKLRKLVLFNIIFIIAFFIYRFFIKRPEPKFLKRIRNAIINTIVVTFITSFIIPSYVFGKEYVQFLKAVKVSAKENFKDPHSS